ncbi:MAG: hypothetical protein WCR42_05130 [bacterium]
MKIGVISRIRLPDKPEYQHIDQIYNHNLAKIYGSYGSLQN